jgi:hypothetical protein
MDLYFKQFNPVTFRNKLISYDEQLLAPRLTPKLEDQPLSIVRDCLINIVAATFHRLRVLENTVLRKIFGPKRDEVTGGWRTLHNEELHNLYSSPSTVRMNKSRGM